MLYQYKSKQDIPMTKSLLYLNIDTCVLNLLSVFYINFLPKVARKKYVAHSLPWELFGALFLMFNSFPCWEIITQIYVIIITIKSMICHSMQCPPYCSNFPVLKWNKQSSWGSPTEHGKLFALKCIYSETGKGLEKCWKWEWGYVIDI